MSACTCTTGPGCSACRPPCQWIVSHLGEIPALCGDSFYTHINVDLAVCASHFEYWMLHRIPDPEFV